MVVKHLLLLVPWRVTPCITGLVVHLVPPPHVPIGISQAGEGGEARSEQRCHLWQGCGPFKGVWNIPSGKRSHSDCWNITIFNRKYIDDSIRGPHFPTSYVRLPECRCTFWRCTVLAKWFIIFHRPRFPWNKVPWGRYSLTRSTVFPIENGDCPSPSC